MKVYEAMHVTEKALETHPNLVKNIGWGNDRCLGEYVVRRYGDAASVSFGLFDREEFHRLFHWVEHEVGETWREVYPIPAVPLHPDPQKQSDVVTLKVTHMGDYHTTMLIDVPRDCPENARFNGVSLIHMVRLLESFGPAYQEGLHQGHSWSWELDRTKSEPLSYNESQANTDIVAFFTKNKYSDHCDVDCPDMGHYHRIPSDG